MTPKGTPAGSPAAPAVETRQARPLWLDVARWFEQQAMRTRAAS